MGVISCHEHFCNLRSQCTCHRGSFVQAPRLIILGCKYHSDILTPHSNGKTTCTPCLASLFLKQLHIHVSSASTPLYPYSYPFAHDTWSVSRGAFTKQTPGLSTKTNTNTALLLSHEPKIGTYTWIQHKHDKIHPPRSLLTPTRAQASSTIFIQAGASGSLFASHTGS